MAEDESIILLDLEQALREFGCELMASVGSVEQALAFLASQRPDAALIDFDLADGSAAPLAEALAAESIPFAVATSYTPSEIARHMALRDAPYLAKPYGLDELREVLLQLVALK